MNPLKNLSPNILETIIFFKLDTKLTELQNLDNLIENPDAKEFLDQLICQHFIFAPFAKNADGLEKLQTSKTLAKDLCLVIFTKPQDVVSRLEKLGYVPNEIKQITENMQQPGVAILDDLSIALSSTATSAITSCGIFANNANTHSRNYSPPLPVFVRPTVVAHAPAPFGAPPYNNVHRRY